MPLLRIWSFVARVRPISCGQFVRYVIIDILESRIMAEGLVQMKLEHAEEVADLLARNFKSNNPVWSSFDLDQNEIHNFFLVDIKKHLESQERTRKDTSPEVSLNMIYIHEGKIIAAGMNLELHDYLSMASEPCQSEVLKQFSVLESHGKKMFEAANIAGFQKNKHLYGTWITVDEKVSPQMKKQFRNQAILFTYVQYMQLGFKSIILRASSPKSAHIYSTLGAKVLSQSQVELKDQKLDLILMQLQFSNPVFQKLISGGQ